MKAQFVKTFIKAAAIVALATSIANCGAMPEESITETTYQPSPQPTAPTTPAGPTIDVVRENCESWGWDYDEATNTCNEPDKVVTTCEDKGMIEENGTCVRPEETSDPIIPVVIEVTDNGTESGTEEGVLLVTTCEDFGLVEENGTCVEPEVETDPIILVVPEDYELLNFSVTTGQFRVDVSFTEIEGATSYTIERVREGSSRVEYVPVNGTTYSFLTFYCSAYSYKLVANMADGTTVETPATDYVAPTNCE